MRNCERPKVSGLQPHKDSSVSNRGAETINARSLGTSWQHLTFSHFPFYSVSLCAITLCAFYSVMQEHPQRFSRLAAAFSQMNIVKLPSFTCSPPHLDAAKNNHSLICRPLSSVEPLLGQVKGRAQGQLSSGNAALSLSHPESPCQSGDRDWGSMASHFYLMVCC